MNTSISEPVRRFGPSFLWFESPAQGWTRRDIKRMETQRKNKQTRLAERARLLGICRDHRDEWGPTKAAKMLGVSKGTLLGWRKELSDSRLSFVRQVPSDPGWVCKKGSGFPQTGAIQVLCARVLRQLPTRRRPCPTKRHTTVLS